MACCCEQPGFGVLRQAVSWPGLECGNERFAEGILSARHVVRVDGKIRHQTAVGFSGHALYGPPYGALDVLLTAFIHPVNPRRMASGASGRTSTAPIEDRKSTRLNSSHSQISYAVFCLKKKKKYDQTLTTYPIRFAETIRLWHANVGHAGVPGCESGVHSFVAVSARSSLKWYVSLSLTT